VRRIAAEIGLPNAKKKDSTGICFIGERPFREFLNRYISHAPGPIKDERGRKLGQHVGLSFYTLGQRQGLGIGGVKEKGAQRGGGEHAPWFVARKELATNTCAWCRATTTRGCCRTSWRAGCELVRRPRARAGPVRRQDALPPAGRRLHAGGGA
jgi:tRNA U34 2-thiouridine synthase MnmA/TrmU